MWEWDNLGSRTRRSDNCSCWSAQTWDKAKEANHRPIILLTQKRCYTPTVQCSSKISYIFNSSTGPPASYVLLFKGLLLSVINKSTTKMASVFVKSSLTWLLPHQSLLPLSSSTFSLKFYFLFHRPGHNATLLTTLFPSMQAFHAAFLFTLSCSTTSTSLCWSSNYFFPSLSTSFCLVTATRRGQSLTGVLRCEQMWSESITQSTLFHFS